MGFALVHGLLQERESVSQVSASFSVRLGLGDAIGVMVGHCAYFDAKRSISGDEGIDTKAEAQTGLLLASAVFCSGTVWQPLVDALQVAESSFAQVFVGTWIGCGTAFYLGLRGARTILSGICDHIHGPTYENSNDDKEFERGDWRGHGFLRPHGLR
jgi:hypothetical protein